MDRTEVFNTVTEILNVALLCSKKFNLEDHLKDDLGLDSIGFVELGTGLEEKYMVDISDEDLEAFNTVGEVVDAVMTAPALVID